MLDMTELLRPFFWLMVGIAALAPAVILLGRRCHRASVERPARLGASRGTRRRRGGLAAVTARGR
jgi:hypothetical protein